MDFKPGLLIVIFSLTIISCRDISSDKVISIKENAFYEEDNTTSVNDTIFGVKVKKWDDEYYQIVFTKDNYITEENVLEVLDGTGPRSDDYISLAIQLYLDKSLTETVDLAKTFDSYEKCLEYNRKMQERYRRLKEKYKDRPTFTEYQEAKNKKSNREMPKEVIIY